MNSKRNRKKEGFLHVKLSSRSALGKAWKRKWVVVQHNTSSSGKSLLLELYVEKGAYHKTVTSLLLEDVVSVRRIKSKTQEHAIEISSAAKTLLGVSADSETETQEWLNMFQMNLLPPIKELPCPPGIPHDFVRVSVIPNKDSQRLELSGDYFAHVSLASINLYNTRTGDIALEWDLRHLKKFMLMSKCHPLDMEKILHIFPSKRSPKGEGEFMFFSTKGKQLVEGIYERLSNAMTVKSRRSRSTSMLFEITPQELEQMFKETEEPPEQPLQEAEEEAVEATREEEGEVNGDASENAPSGQEVEEDEKDGVDRHEDSVTENRATPTSEEKMVDAIAEETDEAAKLTNETNEEENEVDGAKDGRGQVEDAANGVQDGEVVAKVGGTAPNDATLENVAQQPADANTTSQIQDVEVLQHPDEKEKAGNATEKEIIGQEDDKANQTNPEEMDSYLGTDTSPSPSPKVEENARPSETILAPSQQGANNEVGVTVPVESNLHQEDGQNEVVSNPETSSKAENLPEIKNELAVSTEVDQGKVSSEDVVTEEDAPDVRASEQPVRTDKEETPNPPLETQLTDSSTALQKSSEPVEDNARQVAGDEESKNESGPQDQSSSEGHPIEDIQENAMAEKSTAVSETSSDKEEQANAKECAHLQEIEADSVEYTHNNENVETTSQTLTVELNQEAERETVGTDASNKTPGTRIIAKSQDEISQQSPPENANELMNSTAGVDINVSVEPVEQTKGNAEAELSGNSIDDLNPNQNNSNANQQVGRNNKTVPLPNSLTSRMAEALRNAHKRKLSSELPPNQQTQTDFPPDDRAADIASEIIV